MAGRLVLACLLALSGLGLLAFADLPPGLFGMPYRHVPVRATITERVADEARSGSHAVPMSILHYHYAFGGRDYDGSYGAPDHRLLPSNGRRVGDLRVGDVLDIWLDPDRPQFEGPFADPPLGREPVQVVLGLALAMAGLAAIVVVSARARR